MNSLYQQIYNTIIEIVYGGNANAYGEYVAELFSTAAVVFAMSIPFIVVWKVISLIIGR